MKKTIYLKSVLLLCLLLVGAVSTHAEDYDYEWVKVTNLSDVQTGDNVVLVDETNKKALSHESDKFDTDNGYDVTISDGKITSTVPAYLQWTLTKGTNNTYSFGTSDGGSEFLCGDTQSTALQTALQLGDNNDNRTNSFFYDNYDSSGGRLYYRSAFNLSTSKSDYCCVNWNGTMFNAKWYDGDFPKITLYKRTVKNYVKWKRIDSENVNLEEDAVIVVVDLKSGRALSNDKADKDPDAVAVTLNDDKDRILGEVPEKVQWISNITKGKGITLKTKDEEGDKYLYADTENKGLKVGEPTGDNQYFSYGCTNNIYFSLWTSIGSDAYLLGVEESMFSNTWKLIKPAEGEDIDLAFFKKIEDPQKIVTIELAEYYNYDLKNKDQYTLYERDFNEKVTITGAEKTDINWSSSKSATESESAVDINQQGTVTLNKRGTTVITASVDETLDHDKASAKCTVIVDDSGTAELGTKNHPLTVKEAKELAETKKVELEDGTEVLRWEEGVNYYIKGKVSKVNSGMLAMFDGMDLGGSGGIGGNSSGIGGGTGTGSGSGIGGGSGTGSSMDLEDILGDVDMDSMGDTGVDLSSIIPGFGSSEGVTYYISDDATKDNQLKVVNGRGAMIGYNGSVEFEKAPDMSPGDDVLVCGPLEYTEDSSSFSSLFGGSGSDTEEPKYSAKVGELNYQSEFSPTLLVQDLSVYVDRSKNLDELYRIEKEIECKRMEEPTIKSADEEIAKWDATEKKLTGVKAGTVKITVKVKVVLEEKVEGDENSKDRSYTMKRKFILTVLGRDKDPEGKNLGKYVLVTSADELNELLDETQYPESADGIRMLIVGTRTKDDKTSNYVLASENSTMGGGKGAKTIENEKIQSDASFKDGREYIESTDVPDGSQEILLIKEGDDWTFKVGTNEEGKDLYLYVAEKEESTTEGEGTTEGDDSESKFDFSALLEMFMPSTGLKVGTLEEAGDNYKATINFGDNGIATVTFHTKNADNDKNILMLTSSFDLEALMNSTKTNNETSDDGNTSGGSTTPGSGSSGSGSGTGSGSSYGSGSGIDLSSLDLFMASFNAKAAADATGDSPKAYLPRIFAFQQADSYETTISAAGWKTIVSDYDVTPGEGVTAYIVTEVRPDVGKSLAILQQVNGLKSGKPYLLHAEAGTYNMNKAANVEEPTGNLLQKGNSETSSETDKSIYVLSKQSKGVGFYKWVGGRLGEGVVYLPVTGSNPASAHEFCGFFEETTAIQTIEKASQIVGPYYDLQGRRVEKPTHGVYIVNGQKVVIK